MSLGLDGTVALVTGAAGGIGRALVQALAGAGATVTATDLAAEATVPGAALYRQHDVTSQEDWARIAAELKSRHGRLDALVHGAAIAMVASVEATTLAAWRRIQAVNVESILIGTQAMLALLRASGSSRRGGASIVNFSSVGGQRGAAFTSAYCASKGAVKLLSKSMAIEFGALRYNIRVNSVHPGGIHTEMLHGMMQRYVDIGAVPSREVAEAGIIAAHPIGRLGTPEEIGGGVVYLCSPEASFVTGSEFVIDGGFTAV
ncbi:MAG TPA: SDR family oxidoreductase [Steroidobacteraceae bacterium]|nr:SDR family oxidoreductase [Steroidobacteraceae bacterium]